MKPISKLVRVQMPALPITLLLMVVVDDDDDGVSRRTMTKSRMPFVGEAIMSWRYFDVCSSRV